MQLVVSKIYCFHLSLSQSKEQTIIEFLLPFAIFLSCNWSNEIISLDCSSSISEILNIYDKLEIFWKIYKIEIFFIAMY